MNNFSERNGYITPKRIYLREKMTPELINSICNNIELLQDRDYALFFRLERHMWYKVLNKRLKEFGNISKEFRTVSIEYIENPTLLWYEKFDYLEKIIAYLKEKNEREYIWFTNQLNNSFRTNNYVYRIVDEQIVEINPQDEEKPKAPPALLQPQRRTAYTVRGTLRALFQILPF